MSLIINQGKQDTSQDNKFNPIVAKDVNLEITEIKLAASQTNTLEITLRVLDGQYKNRFVFDRVPFDPNSNMAWRYRQIRKCAGVPYQENEPASIDIEALLLHKAIAADLGIRKGKNKDGEETDYQSITYKVIKNVAPVTNIKPAVADTSIFDVDVEMKPAKPTKTKTPKKVEATPTPIEPATNVIETPVKEETTTSASAPVPAPKQAAPVDITDDEDWD